MRRQSGSADRYEEEATFFSKPKTVPCGYTGIPHEIYWGGDTDHQPYAWKQYDVLGVFTGDMLDEVRERMSIKSQIEEAYLERMKKAHEAIHLLRAFNILTKTQALKCLQRLERKGGFSDEKTTYDFTKTIYIEPGIYLEDIALKRGINLCGKVKE